MVDNEGRLNRRRLLAGLTTVGALGVTSGFATTAHLSDQEGLMNNLVTSGELDLTACWERPGEDCTPGNGGVSLDFGKLEAGQEPAATIRGELNDGPGWVWLRTSCPEDACGLEHAVEITVWYDTDCDGTIDSTDGSTIIIQDRLCEALSKLHKGTLLDDTPSETGETPIRSGFCLGIEWEVVEPICDAPDELDVTFELYATDARHNPTPMNPWLDASDCSVDCTDDCYECPDTSSAEFAAFCVDNENVIEQGNISFRTVYDVDGEPVSVELCELDSDVSTIVLYDGDTFWTVDPPTTPIDSDCTAITIGDGQSGDSSQTASDPCPSGCGTKYRFGDDQWETVCDGGS